MGRFLTRRYVAVSWPEAVRLARLEGMSHEAIRYSAEAELIHRTEWWAWWSDELLTISAGLPQDLWPQDLSADAEALISDVWASHSPSPDCGWLALAQVQRILLREPLSVSFRNPGHYPGHWEKLTVEFQAGQQGSLFQFWAGYEEGYLCEIRRQPPEG